MPRPPPVITARRPASGPPAIRASMPAPRPGGVEGLPLPLVDRRKLFRGVLPRRKLPRAHLEGIGGVDDRDLLVARRGRHRQPGGHLDREAGALPDLIRRDPRVEAAGHHLAGWRIPPEPTRATLGRSHGPMTEMFTLPA